MRWLTGVLVAFVGFSTGCAASADDPQPVTATDITLPGETTTTTTTIAPPKPVLPGYKIVTRASEIPPNETIEVDVFCGRFQVVLGGGYGSGHGPDKDIVVFGNNPVGTQGNFPGWRVVIRNNMSSISSVTAYVICADWEA